MGLSVEPGLVMGDLQFNHKVLVANDLSALQFAEQLRRVTAAARPQPDLLHVSPFACKGGTVNLNHFRGKVTLCARSYRCTKDCTT